MIFYQSIVFKLHKKKSYCIECEKVIIYIQINYRVCSEYKKLISGK